MGQIESKDIVLGKADKTRIMAWLEGEYYQQSGSNPIELFIGKLTEEELVAEALKQFQAQHDLLLTPIDNDKITSKKVDFLVSDLRSVMANSERIDDVAIQKLDAALTDFVTSLKAIGG